MPVTKLLLIVVFILLIIGLYYFYPEPKLPSGTRVTSLVVYKSRRLMEAYSDGKLVKSYKISLGRNAVGDKQFEGDKKTPEGMYFINAKNPNSGYHKNLGISYPDAADIAEAKQLGKPTGGDVKIHGLRNGQGFIGKFQRWYDWTAGCIALTDEEVDELFDAVEIGATIEIKP
ncbi:MAG: L,D-transpeptidase family protein [Bacteroidia bacterium]